MCVCVCFRNCRYFVSNRMALRSARPRCVWGTDLCITIAQLERVSRYKRVERGPHTIKSARVEVPEIVRGAFSFFGLRQKPFLHSFKSNLKTCCFFPEIVDLPCFLFRADVFTHSKSPGRLLAILSCVYLALYSQKACVCGCLSVCVCAYNGL